MTDFPILLDLGVIVLTASALVLAARLVRAPSIVAYILAGLLLGPVTGFLSATDTVHLIAELGIALLLFLFGLELSLDKIRDVGRVAVVAGLGQVVFTAAGGFVVSYLLGFNVIESIFIATALTFSSTVVVVKVLTQKRELDTLYGRIAVGIFLVQDLVVIVALTLLTGLGQPEDLSPGALARGIGGAFGGMFLLLAVALLAARYVLPRLFGWMARSADGLFIWSLSWCFLFVVGAELLHVSPEIGAFLAGVSLAQLGASHELRRRVHPLMNFFVMVFFVSLGVQMELGAATEHWKAAVALSLFVLIGNPLIFMFIIARMRYAERTAFLTSVTVAQISEFSFVFAAVGLSAGLIDESVLSLIGLVGLVTISGSVYLILYNHQLYAILHQRGWLRIFGGASEDEGAGEDEAPELKGHVIVVGMNALGRRIVRQLTEMGETVVAVDTDEGKMADLEVHTVVGNADNAAVLEAANLEGARLLVSALQIEDVNRVVAFRARAAEVPVSIHAFDQEVVDELEEIGTEHLIRSKDAGTRRLAQMLRGGGVLGR
jgi:Kef-type K+ transport system membrane component KefB